MKHKFIWLIPTSISIVTAALFPIMAADAVTILPPFLSLLLTYIFASIMLLWLVAWQKKLHELKNKVAWKYGLYVGLLNSVAFYGFYYFGLITTSPGNAALIAQTEVIFSFLFFQAWHKEALSRSHIIGAFLIIIGAIYLLTPKTTDWNVGDILICAGMIFAPFGNHFAKLARKEVSVTTLLTMRYTASLPFLFVLTCIFEWSVGTTEIQWALKGLFLTAWLVFVLKNICWVEAIRHVTVTRILSIHGFAPFLTLLFVWILKDTEPTSTQIISGIPMLIWVLLLCRK